VSPPMLEALVDAIVAPEEHVGFSDDMNRDEGSVQVLACEALAHLGASIGLSQLISALERGGVQWRAADAVRVAESVLDVAFFGDAVRARGWHRHVHEYPNGGNIDRDTSHYDYTLPVGPDSHLDFECWAYDDEAATNLKARFERDGNRAFSDNQRRAIEAVLQCEPFWQVKTNLMEAYGLPTDESELWRFLYGGEPDLSE
jgi:hypothetical protein